MTVFSILQGFEIFSRLISVWLSAVCSFCVSTTGSILKTIIKGESHFSVFALKTDKHTATFISPHRCSTLLRLLVDLGFQKFAAVHKRGLA